MNLLSFDMLFFLTVNRMKRGGGRKKKCGLSNFCFLISRHVCKTLLRGEQKKALNKTQKQLYN